MHNVISSSRWKGEERDETTATRLGSDWQLEWVNANELNWIGLRLLDSMGLETALSLVGCTFL